MEDRLKKIEKKIDLVGEMALRTLKAVLGPFPDSRVQDYRSLNFHHYSEFYRKFHELKEE